MADNKPRAIAKGQFTRALNVLKKDLAATESTTPLATLERHQKDFIDKWQKVQDIHDEYVLSLVDPTPEKLETEDNWLDELATRFSDIEVAVDTLIEQRKKSDSTAA